MPQIVHFEKLLFCSGNNLSILLAITIFEALERIEWLKRTPQTPPFMIDTIIVTTMKFEANIYYPAIPQKVWIPCNSSKSMNNKHHFFYI